MDHHDEELMNCVRTLIKKDEEVTRNKLHERCRIDYRTVENHLPHILNKDLGNGDKIVRGTVRYPGWIKDPPGEAEMVIGVDPPAERDDSSWEDFGAGILAGGIIVAVAGLVTIAILQSRSHVHSWSPCPGAQPWVGVCTICGTRGGDLNDPQSPVHFVPAQN